MILVWTARVLPSVSDMLVSLIWDCEESSLLSQISSVVVPQKYVALTNSPSLEKENCVQKMKE